MKYVEDTDMYVQFIVSDRKIKLVNIHYIFYQKFDIHCKLDNVIMHYY